VKAGDRRGAPRPPGRTGLSLVLGGGLIGLVVGAALASLVWTPHPPDAIDFSVQLAGPSLDHPLGTDHFGRDLASRLLVGARSALAAGALAVTAAGLLGGTLGLAAGWAGGWADELLMRVVDVLYAFPAILTALLLAAVFEPGRATATAAIAVATVPAFARIARAAALALRQAPFVEAGRALGVGPFGLIVRYVLPGAAPPLVVQASLSLSVAILADAALSFLGLGAPPDVVGWGAMLREAQGFLAVSPYPALVPGLAIVTTVLGWSLLGDGLRDRLDPTLH
jgi:peptide/nickel transport system permease protein